MLFAQHPPPLGQSLLGRSRWRWLIPEGSARKLQDAARCPPGTQPTRYHRVDRRSPMCRAYPFFSNCL